MQRKHQTLHRLAQDGKKHHGRWLVQLLSSATIPTRTESAGTLEHAFNDLTITVDTYLVAGNRTMIPLELEWLCGFIGG